MKRKPLWLMKMRNKFSYSILAKISLEIGAIKINLNEPFKWASGYYMPIYNDNRMLLMNHKFRETIANGFEKLIKSENLEYDAIAGTSTAGISPATTLADRLRCPLIYVREKPKDHGLKKQIEGKLYENEKAILIEDLISTGTSSINAVEGIRNSRGIVKYCLSIFNYGFDEAKKLFEKNSCKTRSLLNYNELLKVAKEENYIHNTQLKSLAEWRKNPWNWGKNHGFPREE